MPVLLCPNCETPAGDRFCPGCGQRQGGRLDLRSLFRDFSARFLAAESGVLPTARGMLSRPGRTARRYLDGERRRFVGPLAWYAICAAAQVLGVTLLSDAVIAPILEGLPSQYFDWLAEQGVPDPRRWAADRYLGLVQSAYSWLGLFSLVLPMALVVWLVLGARAHFAEALAVTLYSIGTVMLVTAVTAQALLRLSLEAHSYFSFGLYIVHAVCSVAGCFGWTWRAALAGLAGIVVAGTCFVYVLGLLTGVVLTTGLPG